MSVIKSLGFILLVGLSSNSYAQLRLIVLSPELGENVYSLGAGDQIVGRIESADYPPSIKSVPSVGDYQTLNAEKILSLAPDLVLAWSGGNPERQLDHLESLGLTVVRFKPQRLSDIATQLTELGELLNRESAATLLTDDFFNRLNQLASMSVDEPLPVFYQLWHDPLLTVNRKSWITEAITLCGGVNIFKDLPEPAPNVNIESVIWANPSLIIGSSELPEDWPSMWTPWKSIKAVANQQFVTIDADQMHRLTLRTLEGVDELCKAIQRGTQSFVESESLLMRPSIKD